MSKMVNVVKGASAVVLLLVSGAGFGAVGQSGLRAGPVTDERSFHAATREQQRLGTQEGLRCEAEQLTESLALIYQFNNVQGATDIARRCELLSVTQGRADYKTLAARIRAMVAIKLRDMSALQSAGETLLTEAVAPEFVADGHMFIAFACTFSGRAGCARTHLDQAKAMFMRHEVEGALEQLMSVEQALLKLEASPGQ